ncbi:unnamed protein product [Ambrosiozyma monospora]|uniref:Unnamed protein product n=1 Tax=Ambrosiozyma monospora TaxID=43982 RepID=A0ACB5UC26_AMBMO|nr:unnamed protein product [Ambrosiozyma monospora]
MFLAAEIGMRDGESVVSLIVKHLICFCGNNAAVQLKRIAIKNLINVCISTPKLFLSPQILKIMDSAFKEESDISLQDAVINELGTFLELEEKKTIERNGLDNKDSKTVELDVQVFHGRSASYVNDGICASLVQRYLPHVLRNCLYDQDEHSLKAIQFLQLIVRVGFANPKLCIPTIIALESSNVLLIRQVALTMHEDLFDKHESLIESSYVDGLKMAVSYRKKFVGGKNLIHETGFLKNFVKVSHSDSKTTSTKKFLKMLWRPLNTLDTEDVFEKSQQELADVRDYLYFIVANFSGVTLKNQDENKVPKRKIIQS